MSARPFIAAAAVAAALVAVPAGSSSSGMLTGLVEEPEAVYGDPTSSFPLLKELGVQVLRFDLAWGGEHGVANGRPSNAADPADPAYDWKPYDRAITLAAEAGIQPLLTIYGTPTWANGGRGRNVAPKDASDLRDFAFAAALRYSGNFLTEDGKELPAVRLWAAWNEPNNPRFLRPQYRRTRGAWVRQSVLDYKRICEAVYDGVHATLIASERVACGLTSPRGNNNPTGSRPSISPINFLEGLKAAGLRRFDAYAHHPYYTFPGETPKTVPKGAPPRSIRITLGNIGLLIQRLHVLYGKRPLWITEYGYQTNPPDNFFGVSWTLQASYLTQAFQIVRKKPAIQMMLWFLLKDEPMLSGWQSGLLTESGVRKPAFAAFQRAVG